MVLSSEHMTEEVYGKAKEDGHDPMDMDNKDFVAGVQIRENAFFTGTLVHRNGRVIQDDKVSAVISCDAISNAESNAVLRHEQHTCDKNHGNTKDTDYKFFLFHVAPQFFNSSSKS